MRLSSVSDRLASNLAQLSALFSAQRQAPVARQQPAAAPAQDLRQMFFADRFESAPAQRQAPVALSDGGPQKGSAQELVSNGHHPADSVYPELSHTQAGLGAQKEQVWNAAIAAGANKQEAALLVAQLMQEGGRDATKDNSGAAANFGPFNLNRDLLTKFGGVSDDKLGQLNENSPAAMSANVTAALTAMRQMGAGHYLDHVRGGATGFEHPNDDTFRFERSLANNAQRVLADYERNPASLSSDQRYASNIPHI